MSSLEDLVLQNLEGNPKEFRPSDPIDIIDHKETASTDEIVALCKDLPEAAARSPQETPYLAAQIVCYLQSAIRPSTTGVQTLALAITYARNPSKDLLDRLTSWSKEVADALREKEYQKLESIAVGSSVSRLDFLQEFFEENLLEELTHATGVQRATARRWLQGGNMTWENSRKILLLARAFYSLRHRQKFSREEALQWYERPQGEGGRSPREMFGSYSRVPPHDLRLALDEIGTSYR